MDVLATRVLSLPDEKGNSSSLVLTIFKPFEAKEYQWRCGFVFGPPIHEKVECGVGLDFIQAVLNCLKIARGYLEGTELFGRVHWQGAHDCGLPWHTEKPAQLSPCDIPPLVESNGTMDILTTRLVGYLDASGVERESRLTLFEPFKVHDEVWRCGFTFDPLPVMTIRYGAGADFIEALLDSLAKARATFEGTAPLGWSPSGETSGCGGFPYRTGRSFWTERAPRPSADMIDVTAG